MWIEIIFYPRRFKISDRSPSARKVWIEIKVPNVVGLPSFSHLPRGRCGLKSTFNTVIVTIIYVVTFREEGVD